MTIKGERKRITQRRERRAPFPAAVAKSRKAEVGRSTTVETPLHIRTRGVELDERLRQYIRTRVGFKLGKYGLRINRVSLRFEKVSGPRGAAGYVCKFKVVLPGRAEAVLSTAGADPRAAFDVAVDAIERAVRRMLEKGRETRRRPAP